ncbi:MAG: FkbM family methyltransferase [Verrucomicrobiota bacterium]
MSRTARVSDNIFTTLNTDKSDESQVELMTPETLLEKHGSHFQRFDLLKLDCEQAEYAILRAAPLGVLGKFRYIIIEFHAEPEGESIRRAQAKFKEAGFSLLRTLRDGLRSTRLFVHA